MSATVTATDTPLRLDEYLRDGFTVLRGALSRAEVDAINAEALRLCRLDFHHQVGDGTAPDGSAAPPAALSSATGDSDAEVLRRYLCVHFPHKLSGLMAEALRHPRIVDALTQIIGPDVKAMQSMLFLKAEGKPGQAWHQDELFIPTRDRSLTAAWIALDDARVDNGCLWALPGSHRPGVLYPEREHDDPNYDCTWEAYDFPYTQDDAVPLEVDAGDVVLFNGYLLHKSLPNTSTRMRRALVHHYMSAQSLLPWFHQPEVYMGKTDFRDVVQVAGTDPYAYRGYQEISVPQVRPDRQGGCKR
ncbi:phytanoyl-CoA dioxygenase family protein [Micromonospora sp. NPDC050980]|uniref:phytanoyl-CoA dioxygenase family protein n=1 Tax=Micromonospora sp. NPDC050980 TaxID=3155161 RepID=UPI0033F812C2